MEYNIKAKPIEFRGRLYRSRLEARWAVFFEKIGWKYEYEPSEINGSNPDFIIQCTSECYDTKHIIVEVKPSVFITKEYINDVFKKYYSVPAHIIILSDTPFYFEDNYFVIGVGSQFHGESKDHEIRSEMFHLDMKCVNDFGSSWMIFDGMIFGKVERKSFIQKHDINEIFEIEETWASAGNEVMFLKPTNNG